MEIQEIIRRWQAGDSQRKIALGGLSRDTIAKYVAAAQDEGRSGWAGCYRGAVEPAGDDWAVHGDARAGPAGAVGGPDLPVAHR